MRRLRHLGAALPELADRLPLEAGYFFQQTSGQSMSDPSCAPSQYACLAQPSEETDSKSRCQDPQLDTRSHQQCDLNKIHCEAKSRALTVSSVTLGEHILPERCKGKATSGLGQKGRHQQMNSCIQVHMTACCRVSAINVTAHSFMPFPWSFQIRRLNLETTWCVSHGMMKAGSRVTPEMASDAMTLLPMAAWMGILNCCRGISSFSLDTRSRPTWYALSLCTIDARGSATCVTQDAPQDCCSCTLQCEERLSGRACLAKAEVKGIDCSALYALRNSERCVIIMQ